MKGPVRGPMSGDRPVSAGSAAGLSSGRRRFLQGVAVSALAAPAIVSSFSPLRAQGRTEISFSSAKFFGRQSVADVVTMFNESQDRILVSYDELPRSSQVMGALNTLPKELHQLSIRHLAAGPDGTIGFGMQYEGPPDHTVPLAGTWAADGTVALLTQQDSTPAETRNYVGDLAIDATGRYLAASFPRGGRVGVWDLAGNRPLGFVMARDACGLAAEPGTGQLWISDGTGEIGPLDPGHSLERRTVAPIPGLAFDNHFARI